MVSRLGEGVREELKRALYGTASVSGCFSTRVALLPFTFITVAWACTAAVGRS